MADKLLVELHGRLLLILSKEKPSPRRVSQREGLAVFN
jgi:hypothetical protein